MTTTDTPRTDAVQFQKKPISLSIENEMLRALSREIERELTASKAEVERLNGLLSDLLVLTEKIYWNSNNYKMIKEAHCASIFITHHI